MNMLAKLPARRWWYLMPIIFITYSLAYLDRCRAPIKTRHIDN